MNQYDDINFEDMPFGLKNIFMMLGNGALSANNEGMTKEIFVKFAEEIWNTMELNGIDKFQQFVVDFMVKEATKITKNF